MSKLLRDAEPHEREHNHTKWYPAIRDDGTKVKAQHVGNGVVRVFSKNGKHLIAIEHIAQHAWRAKPMVKEYADAETAD